MKHVPWIDRSSLVCSSTALACVLGCNPGDDRDTAAGMTTTMVMTSSEAMTTSEADSGESTMAAPTSGGSTTLCTRDPEVDAECVDFWGGFGEDLPEAWACPEDEFLPGECASSSFGPIMWMGYCCPAGFMP